MCLVSRNRYCLQSVCVCVCTLTPEAIGNYSGMMWILYDWLNKLYSCCMGAAVGMVSRCDLSIDVHRRNLLTKSKLILYKPFPML